MTEQQATTATADPAVERTKLCLMLYGIFAGSLVLQFINLWTIVLGSAAVIAGIIICYTERKKAYGTLTGNHLQWLIRTFWIGGAVYLPIFTVISTLAMFFFIDWTPMKDALATGEGDIQTAIQALLMHNQKVIYLVTLVATSPFSIWWLWRCWYGYKRLKAGKPIPNVTSWI